MNTRQASCLNECHARNLQPRRVVQLPCQEEYRGFDTFYILLGSVINRDVYLYRCRRSSHSTECRGVAGGSGPHSVREHLHGQRLRRHALHGRRGVFS